MEAVSDLSSEKNSLVSVTGQPPVSNEQPGTQDLNRLLQLQRDLLSRIALLEPLETILHSLCSEVEKLIPESHVFVMKSHADQSMTLLCAPTIKPQYHIHLRNQRVDPNAPPWGRAVFVKAPEFESHTSSNRPKKAGYSLFERLKAQSCWSYPLYESADQVSGSFTILRTPLGFPSPLEARIHESAAHIASIALSKHQHTQFLQASERRFSNIVSSIPGVVMQTEFDEERRPYFSYVSDGIKPLFGISAQDAMNQFDLVWDHLHHDAQSTLRAYRRATHAKNKLWTAECRLTDVQGNQKWIYIASTPEWGENRSLIKINSILLDVTQEKETQAQLELAGIAFASTSEGIMVTDNKNRIVNINRAYCEMTGFKAHELLGRSPSIFSTGACDRRKFNTIFETLLSDGYWQGEVWGRRRTGEHYPQWLNITVVYNEHGIITHFVSVAADLSNVKESEARLRYMSQHDTLTDLPNRDLFKKLLDHAISEAGNSQRIAVLMIDLDRFKYINDTFGHQEGDQLLIQVSRRVRKALGDKGLLARVGGDEFTIMISPCSHQGEAERIASTVISTLEQPFRLKDHQIYANASIGMALYPDHGFDSTTLIKNADTAVHKAKESGRNKYACYRKEHSQFFEQWMRLEPDLRQALSQDQFRVFYQPQIDAMTGQLSGVEALLRWEHPTQGLMSPGEFLTIIEELGLMVKVGSWVIEQACAQAAKWRKAGFPYFKVAVNIAGQQILTKGLVDWVSQMLTKYDISPAQLELEIVENIVVKHADEVTPVLNALKDMGISLALDDFGTGYSSLSYLKMLPIQKVKIDQSLVRDIPTDSNDEAIARAVIALGHSLNLCVCAEGVESKEHQIFLRREGCDQLQGYLISRPVPAEALNSWMLQQAHLLNNNVGSLP